MMISRPFTSGACYLIMLVCMYIPDVCFFQICYRDALRIIHRLIMPLHNALEQELRWPSPAAWHNLEGTVSDFPRCVGMIDATIHPIWRPKPRLQRAFYRGDKKRHFMSSQIICTPDLMIVHVETA